MTAKKTRVDPAAILRLQQIILVAVPPAVLAAARLAAPAAVPATARMTPVTPAVLDLAALSFPLRLAGVQMVPGSRPRRRRTGLS